MHQQLSSAQIRHHLIKKLKAIQDKVKVKLLLLQIDETKEMSSLIHINEP